VTRSGELPAQTFGPGTIGQVSISSGSGLVEDNTVGDVLVDESSQVGTRYGYLVSELIHQLGACRANCHVVGL
jgi:hypothetical protein